MTSTITLAHNEHNKPKKSGAYFLIIFGALIFILVPMVFTGSPDIGIPLIVLGFLVGGMGFYLNFIKRRRAN